MAISTNYTDLLLKKYLGVVETSLSNTFANEAAGNARPNVFTNQIYNSPIPNTAPSGPSTLNSPLLTIKIINTPSDLLFTGYVSTSGSITSTPPSNISFSSNNTSITITPGIVYTSKTYPYIQYIQHLPLSSIGLSPGTSYRYTDPTSGTNILKNMIPFNYDPAEGSYTNYLYTGNGSKYFGSNLINQKFYLIDCDAGYLMFINGDYNEATMGASPLISFYRYNGVIGIPTNLGSFAGAYNQNLSALAYGTGAGQYDQGTGSIAIGSGAGETGQGQYSIAIGSFAGPSRMVANSIVLNASGTAFNTSGPTGGFYVNPIASHSGSTGPFNLLAYGRDNQVVQITGSVLSALTNTSNISVLPGSIDIGVGAGSVGQGVNTMAIGEAAGQFYQATGSIAIGYQAGRYSQGTGTMGSALAIGYQAGVTGQNTNTVAVGFQAGNLNQGTGSIAVGYQAGSIVPSSVSGSTGSAYLTSGNFPLSLSMYSVNTFSGSLTISVNNLSLNSVNIFTLSNTSIIPGMITSNIGIASATATNIVLQNSASIITVNTQTKSASGTSGTPYTFTYPSKIVMSSNGQYQLGSIGNTVYISTNSGVSFRPTTLSTSNLWTSIAISGNGQYMIAYSINSGRTATSGLISSNYGSSFSNIDSNAGFGISSVAISYTGQYIITVGGFITNSSLSVNVNISSNFGETFSQRPSLPSSSTRWVTCSMSSSGQYMLVASTTTMHLSTNFGLTFSTISSLPVLVGITNTPLCWYTSYVSGNGQCMIAVSSTYAYYISTNYGTTWVLGTFIVENTFIGPYSISLTNTCQFLVAIDPLNKSTIYFSPSYKTLPSTRFDFGGTGNGGTGKTIQLLSLPSTSTITSTAISADGTYLTLATTTGFYNVNMNSAGNSIALGYQAGQINQSLNTVAIGTFAGQINQHANTIVLNASGSGLNTSTNGGLFVAPINPSSLATSAGVGLLGYSTSDSQIVAIPAMFDSASDIIALGNYAGSVTGTTNNSIVLNASGTGVQGNGPTGGFYVAPVGSSSGSTGPFTLLAYGADRQIVSITGTALTALGIGGGSSDSYGLNEAGLYKGSKTDQYTIYTYSYSHYSISWPGVPGFINTDLSSKCFISGWAGMALITGGVARLLIGSNGNVGIGITDPETQSNLTVAGAIGVTNRTTAYLRLTAEASGNYIQSGSSLTSSTRVPLHFTGSLATGSFVTIDANGNLGVGTALPGPRLHVYNSVDTETGIMVENNNAGAFAYAALILKTNSAANALIFLNSTGKTNDGPALCMTIRNDAGALRLQSTGGNGIFVAPTSGNVGVGTASPICRLDVSGDARVTGSVTATSFAGSAVDKLFNNMGANHGAIMGFDASSPSYGFGFRFVHGTNGPGSSGGGVNQFYTWYTGLGNEYPATGAGSHGAMFAVERFSTNPYLHVRYNENNSLGSWRKISAGNTESISNAVGGTYTWTGVNYFRTNNGGYSVNNSNTPSLQAYSTGNNSAFMSFHKGGVYAINMGLDEDNVFRIGGWSAAANRLQLDMSGNLTMAGDITAFSDARVKENVKTIENALSKTLALRGVSYNRTDSEDKKTKIGVIAQEVLKVIPEVVNQDNDGMYNVSYGNLGGLFIEAIKEQQAYIEELKTKNEMLEQKVNETNDLLHQLINKLGIQI